MAMLGGTSHNYSSRWTMPDQFSRRHTQDVACCSSLTNLLPMHLLDQMLCVPSIWTDPMVENSRNRQTQPFLWSTPIHAIVDCHKRWPLRVGNQRGCSKHSKNVASMSLGWELSPLLFAHLRMKDAAWLVSSANQRIFDVTCSIFRVPVFIGGLTIKWWWLCTGMWVPLIFTIIILWVYLLLIFGNRWSSWTWGVKDFAFMRFYPPLFAQRIAATSMAAHETGLRCVTCQLKDGIYIACIISCAYLGAIKMSSLNADNENESIEPNFKQCMLNFWCGQLLRVEFNNLSFLREPWSHIIQGINYIISDHFCIDSRHFQAHRKKSMKFVEFECPALYVMAVQTSIV